jgi:RNA polymerase sigma-32 factor
MRTYDITPLRRSALTPPSVDAGLSRYLAEIRKFPILTAEEELAYAKRWREHRDGDAAFQLVTSHLRLVAKIAMRYRGYGLPIADIVSEGNIGLMRAVKRFDPDRGVRLATYAMWWIRATIQEYILRSWSHVKVAASATQKKLFFKLRQAKGAISAFQDGDLRPDQAGLIAERLKVAERDVVDMNRRLQGDLSLNAPVHHDEDKAGDAFDWLVDPTPTQETTFAEQQEIACRHQALTSALATLNPRERRIFTARRLTDEPPTLEELAAEHGVSRERVRQIEQRAFQKVQAAIRSCGRGAGGKQPDLYCS